MSNSFVPAPDASLPLKYTGSHDFVKMMREADYLSDKNRRSITRALKDRQTKIVANRKKLIANGVDYNAALANYDSKVLELFTIAREFHEKAQNEALDLEVKKADAINRVSILTLQLHHQYELEYQKRLPTATPEEIVAFENILKPMREMKDEFISMLSLEDIYKLKEEGVL